MQVKNETAVVVGVGPGLGSALVNIFAKQGYSVFAAARGESAPDAPASSTGEIIRVKCDATDPAQVEDLFSKAERHGPLRVAVFNAGVFQKANVVETDPAEFERCWRVGCFGGFLVGRAAAKAMLKHGAGTILFTGATASLRGAAGFANLASPKFALRAVAQSLARELGPKGIHVAHAIIDGQIHSRRYAHLADERGPDSLLDPTAIAEAYLALHRQPRSAWTQELDLRPWVEKF
ncbi:MAG TPA: SDR family NAD(P)-dependent oxidoreductase [Steroidobacteraceae bacterium]|nr:SDR family NAD(P)-dependent oxidoreductase [Steroidobacteraceae bacterium]